MITVFRSAVNKLEVVNEEGVQVGTVVGLSTDAMPQARGSLLVTLQMEIQSDEANMFLVPINGRERRYRPVGSADKKGPKGVKYKHKKVAMARGRFGAVGAELDNVPKPKTRKY